MRIKRFNEINEKVNPLKDEIVFNIIEYTDGRMLLEASHKGKILFYISDDMVDSDNRIDQYNPSDFIKMWEDGTNFKDSVYAKFRDFDISKLRKL